VFIGVPNQSDRQDIFRVLVERPGILLDDSVDLDWLAEATPGYVGADLELLVQQALYQAMENVKVVCLYYSFLW
jgi:SpoVK/Ycf46/Vps4 family AAA+-type ATPase